MTADEPSATEYIERGLTGQAAPSEWLFVVLVETGNAYALLCMITFMGSPMSSVALITSFVMHPNCRRHNFGRMVFGGFCNVLGMCYPHTKSLTLVSLPDTAGFWSKMGFVTDVLPATSVVDDGMVAAITLLSAMTQMVGSGCVFMSKNI